jgi:hypothetical protein
VVHFGAERTAKRIRIENKAYGRVNLCVNPAERSMADMA